MKFIYISILIISFAGMVVLDYKFKLAFFNNAMATIKSITISASLLLFIDIVGVNWKIFSTNQAYVVGLGLGSENIPVEELVFLAFISYFILCTYNLILEKVKNV